MKKLFLFLIPILFWGCQKEFNNVVDVNNYSFYAKSVSAKDSVIYLSTDSLVVFGVSLNSISGIQKVYCDIYSPDGSKLNNDQIQLLDNGNIVQNGDSVSGDETFSNKVPFSHYYLSGNYQVNFYVEDMTSNSSLLAKRYFYFSNGAPNYAPVISNLIMPDTVGIGQTFILTLKVTDQNGAGDISSVYFKIYRPDGSLVVNSNGLSIFPMYDNGDTANDGDAVANDGIYSYLLTYPSGSLTGKWTFIFAAKDRGGLTSNLITHYIIVR